MMSLAPHIMLSSLLHLGRQPPSASLLGASGNLLSDGMNTYTYDSANRLTTVHGPSSTVRFAYNGLGDRLAQTVNGQTTPYTLDLAAGRLFGLRRQLTCTNHHCAAIP